MGFSPEKAYPVVRSIFILLVLLSALCAGLHTVADYDMGWQLATGRYVVQHHQVTSTDVLSLLQRENRGYIRRLRVWCFT